MKIISAFISLILSIPTIGTCMESQTSLFSQEEYNTYKIARKIVQNYLTFAREQKLLIREKRLELPVTDISLLDFDLFETQLGLTIHKQTVPHFMVTPWGTWNFGDKFMMKPCLDTDAEGCPIIKKFKNLFVQFNQSHEYTLGTAFWNFQYDFKMIPILSFNKKALNSGHLRFSVTATDQKTAIKKWAAMTRWYEYNTVSLKQMCMRFIRSNKELFELKSLPEIIQEEINAK